MFSTHKDARARLHALYVLEGLNALDITVIQQALKDPQAGIREQALILSEQFPELLIQMIPLVDDTSVQVAFQATLSIGVFSSTAVTEALAKVIQKYMSDTWFQKAVLCSNAGSSPELMSILVRQNIFAIEGDEKNALLSGTLVTSMVSGVKRKRSCICCLFLQTKVRPYLKEYRLAGSKV